MFNDFENNLREMGFGDIAVNKKMKLFEIEFMVNDWFSAVSEKQIIKAKDLVDATEQAKYFAGLCENDLRMIEGVSVVSVEEVVE